MQVCSVLLCVSGSDAVIQAAEADLLLLLSLAAARITMCHAFDAQGDQRLH